MQTKGITQLFNINRSLRQLIQDSARKDSAAPAILALRRRPLTYGRLLDRIDDVHRVLRRCGVGRRDRVALLVPNGPESAVAFLAVAASAACAPINPEYRERELDSYLADVNASLIIVDSRIDLPARDLARRHGIPLMKLTPERDGEAGAFRLSGERIREPAEDEFGRGEDTALVLLTSGTTARPKRVPLTHANLCAIAHQLRVAWALTAWDRSLDMFPLHHSGGLNVALSTLAAGGAVICPPRFEAETFFAFLGEFRPTWYAAVPAVHRAILSGVDRHGGALRHCALRFICTGAAAATEGLIHELERTLTAPVIQSYGLTEVGVISSNPLPPGLRKAGSVGVSVGPDVAVVDEHGTPVPPGTTGEVVVRGPNVFPGYEDDPEGPAAGLHDGWFRTRDFGMLDVEGYLFLKGRAKDLINRGGEKIWPKEIEESLQAHPAVAEAVVFPLAHPTLGEDVAAAVVPHDAATVTGQQLREFAALRLPDFKVPSRILVVDRIPTGPTGKVRRHDLADYFAPLLPTPFVAPRDPLERMLAGIWAETLRLDRVGVHDNFFELGGDSLRAGQVGMRVQTITGHALSVATLLQAPTIAYLATMLRQIEPGDLSATRRPLAPGDDGHGSAPPGIGRIPRRDRPASCPLSFAQRRLWFLEQLAPNSCVFNVPVVVWLRGDLDVAALRQALHAIVDRHEALRTTFFVQDEEPAQVVAEQWALDVPVADLSALPQAERAGQLDRVLRAEARRPFDLSRDLMLRALLVRLAPDDHALLLTMHHIASDGWSLEVLTRELGHLYSAYREGRAAGLPPLPIQYGDYAIWQRAELAGETLRTQLAFWKAHLAGTPPTLQLPTDRPRPAAQTYRGAQEKTVLSRDLAEALRALSRHERVTLFMTLVAAFQTLLHRYAGTDDVVVGTAIAGRRRPETEDLIGFFVNTLALRTDLSGDPTFRDLLARVRDTVLAAYDHQDLPFEMLVEELRPARSLSWMPLVQVFFVLQDGDQPPLGLAGLTATSVELDTGATMFDVSASVQPSSQGLHVTLKYNTDLYDAGTIRRMLRHYETLLAGIVADPGQPLSSLPLLTKAERHQLLTVWNATPMPFPQTTCIHELVEAQVARTPDAVAVTDAQRVLSYRQLDERANQLAHYLRRRGVGPNVLVGLCLERSVDVVVGLFGVLKAGGAFVPLDPADPPERLAFMIEDARLSVLVAHRRFLQRLPEFPGPAVVCLDADRPAIAEEPRTVPVSSTTADDLCYVLYTSGSTGKPKGVLIPHRAVSNLMRWRQAAFPTNSADVVLQKTPLTFDASLNELIPPLLVGARLVMARPEGERDTRYLIDTIRAERVSRLSLVPSLLRAMIEEPDLEACTSLRWLSCGGEALPRNVLERFRARRDVEFVNLYGPTEATIDATAWVAGQEAVADVVPIGRPIANTQIYVLDDRLHPVPIGIPGEIYIGGAGLARGYLGRPGLTAERFVPHPFTTDRGARLYRTGDLARYRPDGNLEYLGRLDRQVKLRGFRIELGEIEAALRDHPDVRDAVVVLRADSPEEKRLVAYLVPHAGTAPTGGALRRFLQRTLPEPMVPSAFVSLPALPLTPSGKVDRNILPAPDPAQPDGAYVAPRDAMERQLAQIWEEILNVHPVGVTDNFFELGGHSLLAVRVVNAIERSMGLRIPVATLFARPSIEHLTQELQEAAEATRRALDELGWLSDEAVRQPLNEPGR